MHNPITAAFAAELSLEYGASVPLLADYHDERAAVLILLSNPGDRHADCAVKHTGVVGVCNPDPTARHLLRLLTDAGATPADVWVWNAIPARGQDRLVRDRERGAQALRRLLAKLPTTRIIVALGGEARDTLRRAKLSGYSLHEGAHPSPRAANQPHLAETTRQAVLGGLAEWRRTTP